jgi:acetylornithine/succinyldiaminopimelate/putrescine aminotransferase
MAITRSSSGQVIKMTAADDAITGKLAIQGIELEHTAAANATIEETAGTPIVMLRTGAAGDDKISFSPPLIVNGAKAKALSAGQLYIYLA